MAGGSEFSQIPSSGEATLARRASWDRDLPGWIWRPGPILTRGLSDRIGAGAYDSDPAANRSAGAY
eukprot:8593080-Alexandrium_andersonii.AAC.1